MMVTKVVENMGHVEAIKKEVSKRLKDSKIGEAITEDAYSKLRSEISKERTRYDDGIPKKYMDLGLKEAGVKVRAPVPEPPSKKPTSPATAESVKSEQETLPEPEPVLVCMNCQAYYVDDVEELSRCLLGIEPTEENECAIHDIHSGRPMTTDYKCAHCGGLTLNRFLKGSDVDSTHDMEFDTYSHDLCYHDHLVGKFDIKGKCHECLNVGCQLLDLVEESHDPDEGSLDIEVKHCPSSRGWFDQRPKVSIEEVNKEVQKRVEAFVKESREIFEKKRSAEAAGRSA